MHQHKTEGKGSLLFAYPCWCMDAHCRKCRSGVENPQTTTKTKPTKKGFNTAAINHGTLFGVNAFLESRSLSALHGRVAWVYPLCLIQKRRQCANFSPKYLV